MDDRKARLPAPTSESESVPAARSRLRAGALAAVVIAGLAAVAAIAAPSAWPAGSGSLRLSTPDEVILTTPITVGGSEEFVFDAAGLEIAAPGGFPIEDPVEIAIRSTSQTVPADLRIELVLPDGSAEIVPVLNRTDDAADALRRPPRHTMVVLVLLAVVIVLWVTEIVPLHVTSLAIPVVLVVGGAAEASGALAPFFDPIIVLFFAGFLMAEAMARVGLDQVIATRIVARAGSSPIRLFATLLLVAAGASMWMSNTAAVALLLPIALMVTQPLDSPSYQRALVLGIAYSATIGGVGSAIGTPANQLAIRFLDEFAATEITFVRWFGFGLPLVGLVLPIIGVHLWSRLRPDVDPALFGLARQRAQEARASAPRPSGAQLRVSLLLAAVMAGWLTQTWHGISTGIVALAGAVALMVTGDVRSEDIGRISWPTLLTFGGGLTLGLALVESGTSDHLVTRLSGVETLPNWIAVAAVAAIGLLLTAVASNTASAATLIPLTIPVAALIGADPVLLAVVVALATSLDFALVIGTPPTMLAHSTGLFTAREILRLGIVLDLVALVLLVTAVTAIWRMLGLV